MASGDTILTLTPQTSTPTATLAAPPSLISGASTPGELIPVVTFDNATQQYIDFYAIIPKYYGGGGLTCRVDLRSDDTTSSIRMGIAFRRIEDTDDLDTTSHSYDYNEVSISSPATVGTGNSGEITFTDGADMDNVTFEDYCIVRVTRNVSHGDDGNAGLAQVTGILIKET